VEEPGFTIMALKAPASCADDTIDLIASINTLIDAADKRMREQTHLGGTDLDPIIRDITDAIEQTQLLYATVAGEEVYSTYIGLYVLYLYRAVDMVLLPRAINDKATILHDTMLALKLTQKRKRKKMVEHKKLLEAHGVAYKLATSERNSYFMHNWTTLTPDWEKELPEPTGEMQSEVKGILDSVLDAVVATVQEETTTAAAVASELAHQRYIPVENAIEELQLLTEACDMYNHHLGWLDMDYRSTYAAAVHGRALYHQAKRHAVYTESKMAEIKVQDPSLSSSFSSGSSSEDSSFWYEKQVEEQQAQQVLQQAPRDMMRTPAKAKEMRPEAAGAAAAIGGEGISPIRVGGRSPDGKEGDPFVVSSDEELYPTRRVRSILKF